MGGKTATTTQTQTIPEEVKQRYVEVNKIAGEAAKTPFQAYSSDPSAFVAGLTEAQKQGISNLQANQNVWQPFYGAGANLAYGAAGPSYANLRNYMSPYLSNVVGTTMQQLRQQQEQEMSGQTGNAIRSGAFGGDRAGIAAANLARQQEMATGSTIANLMNQGYQSALGASQADLARQLAAGQALAGMGTGAAQNTAAMAQALMAAGQQQQQTEQAGKTALYNQFMQERGYPFQVAQFLANIAEGTGALSGSTTTTAQPIPFFSDERLKENIERVGKLDDGQPIYRYNYKGHPGETQIGLLAQDVEHHHPEAVGLAGGYKTVDYNRATDDAASMGGAVHPDRAGLGFAHGGYADGGAPGIGPYAEIGLYGGGGTYVPQAILPIGRLPPPGEIPAPPDSIAKQMVEGIKGLADKSESFGKVWEKIAPVLGFKAHGGAVAHGYADGGMPYGMPSGGGYVPQAVLPVGSLPAPGKVPDLPKSTMQTVADAASTASDVINKGTDLWNAIKSDPFRPTTGFGSGTYAAGGTVDQTDDKNKQTTPDAAPYGDVKGYVPQGDVPVRQLAMPEAPKPQGSVMGDIANVASKIIPFFLSTGGAANRSGYADGGTFRGTHTGREYNVGQKYLSADGKYIYEAQPDGTFKHLGNAPTAPIPATRPAGLVAPITPMERSARPAATSAETPSTYTPVTSANYQFPATSFGTELDGGTYVSGTGQSGLANALAIQAARRRQAATQPGLFTQFNYGPISYAGAGYASGGVAGRHGYATTGAVPLTEEEILAQKKLAEEQAARAAAAEVAPKEGLAPTAVATKLDTVAPEKKAEQGLLPKDWQEGIDKFNTWGKENESFIVPLLSGIGGMLASPSLTFGGALGSGLMAGAQSFEDVLNAQQERALKQAQQVGEYAAGLRYNPDLSMYEIVGKDGSYKTVLPYQLADYGFSATDAAAAKNAAGVQQPGLIPADTEVTQTDLPPVEDVAVPAPTVKPPQVETGDVFRPVIQDGRISINTEFSPQTLSGEMVRTMPEDNKPSREVYQALQEAAPALTLNQRSLVEFANAVAAIPETGFGAPGAGSSERNALIKLAATFGRITGQPVSEEELQSEESADIINKLKSQIGAASSSEQGFATEIARRFESVLPDLGTNPEAARKMIADMMIQKQMQLDKMKYMGDYKNQFQSWAGSQAAFTNDTIGLYTDDRQKLMAAMAPVFEPDGTQTSPIQMLINGTMSPEEFEKNFPGVIRYIQ